MHPRLVVILFGDIDGDDIRDALCTVGPLVEQEQIIGAQSEIRRARGEKGRRHS
jgi:hypothetical protein